MTCSKALNRLTCGFSLLLLAACALGSELTAYRDALKQVQSRDAFDVLLEDAPKTAYEDQGLYHYLVYSIEDQARLLDQEQPKKSGVHHWNDVRDAFVNAIESRIVAENAGAPSGEVKDAKATAKDILKSPIYVDRKEREGRNWLDKVADRLGERFIAWLRKLFPDPNINMNGFGAPGLQGLTVLAWVIIAVVVAVILFFVFKSFRAVGRKRRVGGILEDDEPERTADQWMAQAERLEAEGRFREAVRCLYLACLVRYDDGRIARFRRHETNWEHLYRIEANEQRPRDVDFRDATQRFDKVWYGYKVKGQEDVAHFKEVYKRLCQALQIKTAA